MPVGEIIAIGTELLLGEIQDTNTTYLARAFRDLGIDLYRTTIVGDNLDRIAAAIQEAVDRCDILLTSGGLGPTVDDPTRQAVAKALGVELEYHPELWQQIQERFTRYNRQPSENNRRQAYIPAGACAIENPVGSAPAFYADTGKSLIISLPGVPRELEALIQEKITTLLRDRFQLQDVLKIHVLHCAGVGESQLDEWIGELETLSNPTVGLLAHSGRVDIRIAAKAPSVQQAEVMIAQVAEQIEERVGEAIYGADGETLDTVVKRKLEALGWSLSAVECGLEGALAQSLQGINGLSSAQSSPCTLLDLHEQIQNIYDKNQSQVAFGASLTPSDKRHTLDLVIITPHGKKESTRSYGGPPLNACTWGVNTALDFIRRNIS